VIHQMRGKMCMRKGEVRGRLKHVHKLTMTLITIKPLLCVCVCVHGCFVYITSSRSSLTLFNIYYFSLLLPVVTEPK
jgi:hypothetical protein